MDPSLLIDGEIKVIGEPEEIVSRFFQEARHVEEIAGSEEDTEERDIWRKYGKERMKTVSVALCLCLHIGVEPPDREPRPQPCARLQAWVDPYACSPQKAMAKIAASLQKNYERWQPRARYKVAADPTVEEVRRVCMSMRRNAKDERVLFHYNGHGVPRPTSNGEIWVFNKNYTQYIPLSIYDLQNWMETPSIYVWDCDSAETIMQSFNRFAGDHEKEWTVALDEFTERLDRAPPIGALSSLSSMTAEEQAEAINFTRKKPRFRECIQLAACKVNQNLPTNPDVPADLFTSCLTTPIHMSIKWYLIRQGRKDDFDAVMEEIPGNLTDRRTLLGELNWIFTAITDTIAWNVLPRDLFQRLFRQDLLLASLFRSFLLAERMMSAYGCEVMSVPALPSTIDHHLWDSWEYTIDLCLSHLAALGYARSPQVCPVAKDFFRKSSLFLLNNLLDVSSIQQGEATDTQHTWFFIEQLRAFEVWLEYGVEDRTPPVQLPVVLQVLLSQVHRVRALELLARFLDHGEWAVGFALSVGIFPYVLKLLQSTTRELKTWLAFIWAKILAVDPGCQAELFKENGEESRYDMGQRREKKELRYLYFVKILNDPLTSPRQKVVPAFVLATLFHNNYKVAQQNLTEQGYVNLCTELLSDHKARECRLLKLWILIGLGKLWQDYNPARWQAIRLTAYHRVLAELEDSAPEVRAAAVYALGCLVKNRTEQNEHAQSVAQEICDGLCSKCTRDGSVLVRQELLVALQYFVMDAATTLVALQKRLSVKASRAVSPDDFGQYEEEAADAATLADSSFDEPLERSIPSIRSERSFLGRRKKDSESRAILEELASSAASTSSAPEQMFAPLIQPSFTTSFQSQDVIYRDQTLKILSVLEMKNFADQYERIWMSVLRLSVDPIDKVARMAQTLVKLIDKMAEEKQIARMSSRVTTEGFATPGRAAASPPESGEEAVDAEPSASLAAAPALSPATPALASSSSAVTFTVGSPQTTSLLNGGVGSGSSAILCPAPFTPLGPTRKSSFQPTFTSTPRPNLPPIPFVPALLPEFNPKRTTTGRVPRGMAVKSQNAPVEQQPHEALLATQFVPWCSRIFVEPILDLIQCDTSSDRMTDRVLTQTNPKDWVVHALEGMHQVAQDEFTRLHHKHSSGHSCGMTEQRMCVRVDGSLAGCRRGRGPLSTAHSELRSYVYFSDGDNIGIVSTEGVDGKAGSGPAIARLWPNHAGSAFTTDRCSWLSMANGKSTELLLSGSPSGIFRVWNPHYCVNSHRMQQEVSLVTAAYPLADQQRFHSDRASRADVTLYDWCQESGRLVATGNVKICRVWDAHTEQPVQEFVPALSLKVRGGICALSADLDSSNLVALGVRDGSVTVHDGRMPAEESCILSLAEHFRPLVGVAIRSEQGRAVLAAASDDGLICVWDPRMFKEPMVQVNSLSPLEMREGCTISSMVMHDNAQMLAVTVRGLEMVKVYDISGREINSVRSNLESSLNGSRSSSSASLPGRPGALAFHPHRAFISVLCTGRDGDLFLSAYGPPHARR